MANLTSTGVHYRAGGRCNAAQVVRDDDGTTVDLVVTTIGLLDVVTVAPHRGVELDNASPPDTDGTWHDHGAMDCPDLA